MLAGVLVGQVPAKSGLDAAAFVDKLLTYERLEAPDEIDPSVDTSYLKKITYVADFLTYIDNYAQVAKPEGADLGEGQYEKVDDAYHLALQPIFKDAMQTANDEPNFRLVATAAADVGNPFGYVEEIPFNKKPGGSKLGWFFTEFRFCHRVQRFEGLRRCEGCRDPRIRTAEVLLRFQDARWREAE